MKRFCERGLNSQCLGLFQKVGDGDAEEGGPHLPGDGAGDEGLAET